LSEYGCRSDNWIDPDNAFKVDTLRDFKMLNPPVVEQIMLFSTREFEERHPELIPQLIDIFPPSLTSLTLQYCNSRNPYTIYPEQWSRTAQNAL
jgi:hypothetical protein